MKPGQKILFNDRNKLEEMIKLRRRGLALTSLALMYGVDVSTIRWHLRRYFITHPDEVYTIERIIAKVLPQNIDVGFKVVNGERINLGRSYKDYIIKNGQHVGYRN